MRIAIVAASSYASNGQLGLLPHAEPEVELLSQRLTEPDAGFYVHLFSAERGLGEGIEQLIGTIQEPIEALLFVFSGYAFVSDERGAALVLDGERLSTLSLKRLARTIGQRAQSTLAVLDTVSAFDGQHTSSNAAAQLTAAFGDLDPSIHVLAASRPEAQTGPSPFSSLLTLMLDWQANAEGVTAARLYTAMRAEETLFAEIPAVSFVPSAVDFPLLLPGAAVSMPPAASVPPTTSDDVELRADALVEAGDTDAALDTYAVALERLGPPPSERHPGLYVKIAAALQRKGRDSDALAYFQAAIDLAPNRSDALLGAARLQSAMGDAERALALLNRALTADPNSVGAAELARDLLRAAARWADLASLYEFVLPRATHRRAAVELALDLAELCRDKLGDGGRAAGPLERAVTLAPDEPRLRVPLIELCEQRADHERALHHVLALLRSEPSRAEEYRTAIRLFDQCGRPDAAWNAAGALEVLGEADVNESLLAHTHRPQGLLPARGALTEAEWAAKLLCPERSEDVDRLFTLLADAAIEVGQETARRKRRLPQLDPSLEQDPNTSTATMAKTLLWAARLLGVPAPKLYVLANLEGTFSIPALREATVCANKTLGSGLELADLAFLWGRELALLRPEHRLYSLYPDGELEVLVEAALSLAGASKISFRRLEGEARLFARGLKRHLGKDGNARLEASARELSAAGGSSARNWELAVERAAGRAGLLCCGDLERAARLTERYPLPGFTEPRTQLEDLLAFSVSDEYARLRAKIGVLIG